MKNSYLVGGVVAVIVVAAVLYFLSQNKPSTEPNQESQDQTEILKPNATSEENVETIELTVVGGYTGTGTANRTFNGTNFVHLVIAQLDDPSEGKFYEGWLVKKEPTLTFISTGKLKRGDEGDFALLFNSETDYSDYNDVVITEETESLGLDNNPETHILEGSFSN
ncbi:hypothetical protein A3A54_00530 [Candidatus Curtissbacteria bacterium RIFCSPLOWO2_01_FULL_39_62]|uniref:Anti-sigma K factor RskA C-terminal domain-containing protein n=2 Tax=Candidatus Curtissiibacteriota TaxID=1752717 RepID=A0A1F5G7F4_9BACT|nr:MAG: hypothetical protein A2775_02465 [Candidatus Curtissbacteria bacterium RIFCSPHIGHO2_01_FULL_39_57]OGD87803.1 MAG: hypothetical protein A3D04_02430 [Candidatus Curtissbacteria bacterium RIFCSPHIGHO2_02_FULL_40_16b]OGD90556.1 MAG: hypothetical protein A3E11_01950 [Candidatus Curtissbacteria bacterium RIFCSPHIGHO2_12_FULL_38_37]OGD99827.1 MAG: hypothetical protein A3J17_04575 [Candidatus Curtissbacteria bacterium RIFCSPLOWO2_02_FULL_40_11]OGE01067.1 MAG: hypothetical protein A3A54_00530 [C